MARISRATASDHQVYPGFVDAYEEVAAGWSVTFESNYVDMDQAAFFKGAPNDQCQSHHMGYMLKGRFGIRKSDGSEEIYEAGDAFVIEPGHTPIVFEGSEFVAFTPAEEARQQREVMMPNVIQFARERGIDLPPRDMST